MITMAILRVEEIRKMSREERGAELSELKAELSSLMSKRSMGGSMENPARISLIRQTIAKVYTINREEELGIDKRGKSEKSTSDSGKAKKAEKAKKEKKEVAATAAEAPETAEEPKAKAKKKKVKEPEPDEEKEEEEE